MKRLDQLEQDAVERRQRLTDSISRIRNRLTPDALVAEGLGFIDSNLSPLKAVKPAIRRYPLIAAGALAGAVFLIKRAIRTERTAAPPSSIHKVQPMQAKEKKNGYESNDD